MSEREAAAYTVGELMSRDPILVREDTPLTEAALILEEHRIHGLPVVDGSGALVGVVSQTDMVRARTTQQLWAGWRGLKVRHLMTSPALTVAAEATLTDAAEQMEANHVHRLVVVGPDGTSPVGILSTSDIVRAMISEAGPLAEEVGR